MGRGSGNLGGELYRITLALGHAADDQEEPSRPRLLPTSGNRARRLREKLDELVGWLRQKTERQGDSL